MTTRQMFFVIALVTGAIVLAGFTLFQWLSLFRTGSVADVRAGVQRGSSRSGIAACSSPRSSFPGPVRSGSRNTLDPGADAMRTMLLVDQFQ
jgi:hypothetical protein